MVVNLDVKSCRCTIHAVITFLRVSLTFLKAIHEIFCNAQTVRVDSATHNKRLLNVCKIRVVAILY